MNVNKMYHSICFMSKNSPTKLAVYALVVLPLKHISVRKGLHNEYSHVFHITWYSFVGVAWHYSDVIMGAMAFHINSPTIVYSTVYSGADQRKKSELRVTGLCAGNSPVTGEFPAQRTSNAENVSN